MRTNPKRPRRRKRPAWVTDMTISTPRKMRWMTAAGLLLLSSYSYHAKAADTIEAIDRSALRVCSDPHNLPFSDQQGGGFENKIAELFAQKLNVPLRYVWYPNSIGFLRNTLRARQCDLVMGIVSGAE